jgi:threonine dehydratase
LDALASQAVQDVETADGKPVQLSIGLKAENLQRIGAFKVWCCGSSWLCPVGLSNRFVQARGAMNAVLKYLETEPADEKNVELNLVTHSSGNFAQAVCTLTKPEIYQAPSTDRCCRSSLSLRIP